MKMWKVAFVGAGYMAHEHARAFASLPSVKIVGVCGRSHLRTETFASTYDVPIYKNVKELYEATNADIAIVAVNELSMYDICLKVFFFPWLCFLEKPVGINLSEAKKIEKAACTFGARAYVAFNRRSYSSTRIALEKLSSDEGPRLISILDQQDMSAAQESGMPEMIARNLMYANSIHLIDYFNLFGRGEIVDMQHLQRWNPEIPCYVVVTFRFSSGDIGVYQAVWDGPGPWSVTVTNTQIRAEMRPLEKLGIQCKGDRVLSEIETDISDKNYKPGLVYQAEQVICLLKGYPSILATIKDSTRTMELCSKIYS